MATGVRVSFTVDNPQALGDLTTLAKAINKCANDIFSSFFFSSLSHSSISSPGFVRKYWLHDPPSKKAGGFYVFDSLENAEKYLNGETFAKIKAAVSDVEVEVSIEQSC